MEFELNERRLKYENGEFYIWCEYKTNQKLKKVSILYHNSGYKCIHIGNKKYLLHRILGMLFLGLDINDTKQHIDHIDGNRSNNELSNLRIVTQQQNNWNQTTAKGYCKIGNKFRAKIRINKKDIYLGCFDTEEEAKQAYLSAKSVYHIIE